MSQRVKGLALLRRRLPFPEGIGKSLKSFKQGCETRFSFEKTGLESCVRIVGCGENGVQKPRQEASAVI